MSSLTALTFFSFLYPDDTNITPVHPPSPSADKPGAELSQVSLKSRVLTPSGPQSPVLHPDPRHFSTFPDDCSLHLFPHPPFSAHSLAPGKTTIRREFPQAPGIRPSRSCISAPNLGLHSVIGRSVRPGSRAAPPLAQGCLCSCLPRHGAQPSLPLVTSSDLHASEICHFLFCGDPPSLLSAAMNLFNFEHV